jgi:hypothetical protein
LKIKKRFFRQPIRSRYQPPPITLWDWAISALIAVAILAVLYFARAWLIADYGSF